MIKNLALKGGGVRGIAFVGALRELEAAGMLSNLQRVAGTSAGALVAAMISAGHSVDSIDGLMRHLDFKKFEESWNPLRIATHYGLYSGNYILDFMTEVLEQSPKGLHADCTFTQLKTASGTDLYVFATDLNTFSVAEFSDDQTPDVKVAEAVRASMSIPMFFKAWQFPDGKPNEHLYVDGGVIFNYPITFFDSDRFGIGNSDINMETLGLFLQSKPAVETSARELGFDHFIHYTRHLFETILNTQNLDFSEDGGQQKRSILIDDLGILSTDFHLSEDDMNNLVASGEASAKAYISHLLLKV